MPPEPERTTEQRDLRNTLVYLDTIARDRSATPVARALARDCLRRQESAWGKRNAEELARLGGPYP